MSRSLVSRIKKLEANLPLQIELHLDDGSVFYYRGSTPDFLNEGMAQVRLGGGPIVDALRRTVKLRVAELEGSPGVTIQMR